MVFCPKCKAEYQDGIFVCDDCKADLVGELKQEIPFLNDGEDLEFVTELLTIETGKIGLIKSVLDEENIVYFIQGENALYMQPGVAARLLVKKDQVERVREILKDLL